MSLLHSLGTVMACYVPSTGLGTANAMENEAPSKGLLNTDEFIIKVSRALAVSARYTRRLGQGGDSSSGVEAEGGLARGGRTFQTWRTACQRLQDPGLEPRPRSLQKSTITEAGTEAHLPDRDVGSLKQSPGWDAGHFREQPSWGDRYSAPSQEWRR